MNRNAWIGMAAVVLIIAVIIVDLGLNLVPSREIAIERTTVAGWWLIWVVIGITVASSLALAGFLLAAGLGKVEETRH
jgi:O-antigen/teichoic acid export membrane protein